MFRRLEDCGQLVRLDAAVEPTMYHCATVSQSELASLRRIWDVVRAGRVLRVGLDQIALEQGSFPAQAGHVYVDCTAAGLQVRAARPVFAPGLITLQPVRTCQPAFGAALEGYLEASRHDDAEKNRLCPPNPYPDTAANWIATTCISLHAQNLWLRDRDLAAWIDRSRLNVARGFGDHLAEPRMQSAVTRLLTYNDQAIAKLEWLLSQDQQAGTLSPA